MTGTAIDNIFLLTNYDGGVFNSGDFQNLGQIALIKLMAQYTSCAYIDFLYQADQRLSNLSFLAGTATKLAYQAYDSNSALYVSLNTMKGAISSSDYQ